MNPSERKAAFFARTMHTPDSPERAELRAALRDSSKILIPLHRHLIDAAKDEYSVVHGPVEKPAHLLQLLTDDPFFAWLKPVTSLIVDIDEMARIDFESEAAFAIGDRLRDLFGHQGVASRFAEQYVPILQRDVDVAIGHAALQKAMTPLVRPNAAKSE